MNAIPHPTLPAKHQESAAERDTRHISICCMLTDLAAELAQAAAALALRDLTESPPLQTQTPKPQKPAKHPARLFAILDDSPTLQQRI